MTSSFGPWSTAIHEHGRAQLTVFWEHRLSSLSLVNDPRSANRISTAGLLVVAALGVCLPTFLNAPVQAESDAASVSGDAVGERVDSPRPPVSGSPDAKPSAEPPDNAAVEVERPKLRFLSWKHRRPESDDELLEGPYWLPSGKRVTDEEQLLPLRDVYGRIEQRPPSGFRFVDVFVSHTELRGPSFGHLTLLDADGGVIYRTSPHSTRFARGEGYPEHLRPGWQYYHVTFYPEFAVPEKATIRLRYTAGEGRRAATIPVDSPRDREIIPDVRVTQIDDDKEGRASITVAIDPRRDAEFWYDLTAVDLDGRPVHQWGRQEEPEGRFTRTFRQPLDDVRHFELFEWKKQTVEFKDVAMRPLD